MPIGLATHSTALITSRKTIPRVMGLVRRSANDVFFAVRVDVLWLVVIWPGAAALRADLSSVAAASIGSIFLFVSGTVSTDQNWK